MRSEHDKAPVELAVFGEFVAKANLPIDPASIFKPGEESQPDIFCAYTNGERVAFELFEICAQDIAKVISQLSDGGAAPIVTSDPTDQIVRSKLHKNYKTSIPIELLC